MMGRYPVFIRYLLCTLCIVLLLWGCDRTSEAPAKPKVVRKKITVQKEAAVKVSKKKPVRTAKATPPPKAEKIAETKRVDTNQAEVKTPATTEKETDQQIVVAAKSDISPPPQTDAVAQKTKKPAISPKSDISEIRKPVDLPGPKAGSDVKTAIKEVVEEKPATAKTPAALSPTGEPPMYDPTGKIDPFEPLYQDKPVAVAKVKRKKRAPQTPLERIDLGQLKLVAIIMASTGNRAMVEEASGKGYVIKKGTYIGTNAGKVVEIVKDKVLVEEEFEDVFGKVQIRQRELKLPKPPGEL